MMCIKHMLIYVFVFPLSASPPIFLIALTIALFLRIRPCGYCLTLATILFFSTSSHSPFLNHPSSTSLSHNQTASLNHLPLQAPVPNRTLLSTNNGQIWDPRLVGYRGMDIALKRDKAKLEQEGLTSKRLGSVWQAGPEALKTYWKYTFTPLFQADFSTFLRIGIPAFLRSNIFGSSTPSGKAKELKNERKLPPGYVDLRWKGVGFVVDFGWRRTSKGIQWEIEEMLGRDWDRSELVQKIELSLDQEGEPISLVDAEHPEAQNDENSEVDPNQKVESETAHPTRKKWTSIPFIGSW
ncbi:uncharacterized protein L203_104683 [Cryptococcus depauperatus CBS 7841]|uniref:Uncharacterized protein n=1 Tax=Cryptococcus depauperatus CBS 7841 TaxID=1295531 RepID=A0AAJ8M2G1_9TREE